MMLCREVGYFGRWPRFWLFLVLWIMMFACDCRLVRVRSEGFWITFFVNLAIFEDSLLRECLYQRSLEVRWKIGFHPIKGLLWLEIVRWNYDIGGFSPFQPISSGSTLLLSQILLRRCRDEWVEKVLKMWRFKRPNHLISSI